jgi:hypothetical protein
MYGSTPAANSRTVTRSTPSSFAHRSSGAAIGRPSSRSGQVPTTVGQANTCSKSNQGHPPSPGRGDLTTPHRHLTLPGLRQRTRYWSGPGPASCWMCPRLRQCCGRRGRPGSSTDAMPWRQRCYRRWWRGRQGEASGLASAFHERSWARRRVAEGQRGGRVLVACTRKVPSLAGECDLGQPHSPSSGGSCVRNRCDQALRKSRS